MQNLVHIVILSIDLNVCGFYIWFKVCLQLVLISLAKDEMMVSVMGAALAISEDNANQSRNSGFRGEE